MVQANWSGSDICLCIGSWSLFVNGKDVTDKIPDGLLNSPMGTYGEYNDYSNTDDAPDVYSEGLQCEEWIKENLTWLSTISKDSNIHKEIFTAIQKHDWRYNSCGNCL